MVVGIFSLALAVAAGCDSGNGSNGLVDQDGISGPDLDAHGGDAAVDGIGGDAAGAEADVVGAGDTASASDVSPADTAGPTDTSVAQDTTAGPTDTTAPSDTTTSSCVGECPVADAGPIGIDLTLAGATTQAPTLGGFAQGSAPPAGVYDLTAVDIYRYNTFSALVTVDIYDNYDQGAGTGTNGTANFGDGIWSVYLGLDVTLAASALGQNFDQALQQELSRVDLCHRSSDTAGAAVDY